MKNPDLLDATKRTIIAFGQPTDKFNVRLIAFFIGQQFEQLAALMDAIYGENNFALADELKQWADSFMRGDCDEKVRDGDRKCMLDAATYMAGVAICCAISQGANVKGAFTAAIKANLAKIDPATGLMPQSMQQGQWEHVDMARFINKDAPI